MGEIAWIGVVPDHHGEGIGRELLTAAENRLANAGIDEAFVVTLGASVDYAPIWAQIAAEADVGHIVPHDLRHTCITRLFVVDRWTPAEVQRFVGHSDPRITLAIYSHVTPESLPIPSSFAAQ